MNVISANGFATGNTAWVTGTSHAFSYNNEGVGVSTYYGAGTYNVGSIRAILIATKS